MTNNAENDAAALADEVARILHPHPYREPDNRGRYTIERPANGNDSTMTVFLDTDGHNSMRALTYREVCEAVLASDWFKSRVIPPEACPTQGCPGDVRYSAPGRRHLEGCTYPIPPAEDVELP